MTAFESICKAMDTLDIYNIEPGSNIYNEIACYSVALDEHRALLDEVLKECFIATSNSYGLDNRELMVGNVKSNYTVEKRRQMLLFRNMLGENDFTYQGLDKFMKCFGFIDYQLTEVPDYYIFNVYINGDYDEPEKKWIERQLKLVLPTHLTINIYFKGVSWADIESKQLTFREMDSKNYSWIMIDNLKKEG